jgi:hypothetical protein
MAVKITWLLVIYGWISFAFSPTGPLLNVTVKSILVLFESKRVSFNFANASMTENWQLTIDNWQLTIDNWQLTSCPFPTFELSTDCTCCGFGHLRFQHHLQNCTLIQRQSTQGDTLTLFKMTSKLCRFKFPALFLSFESDNVWPSAMATFAVLHVEKDDQVRRLTVGEMTVFAPD